MKKTIQVGTSDFKKMIEKNNYFVDTEESLGRIIKYVHDYYDKKVILFIDEYDVPIQESYNKGYYDEMISLMQIMLTAALKDNNYVEKSMVTGKYILKETHYSHTFVGISDSHKKQVFGSLLKESIFSGLNNVEVNTIFKHNFNDKFGFTENEVAQLLKYYDLNDRAEGVKEWYNGYNFCGEIIYNPGSVLNYIKNYYDGFIPYWINSSSNDLIKRLLVKGTKETKESLEELISGKQPEKVYHAFVLGLLVSLSNEYEVKSNKESGYGRYDVMIIPKDISKAGIIIEFKRIRDAAPKTLYDGIKEALEQIEDKKYEVELNDRKITEIIKLAIVFKGKDVRVVEA